MLDNCKETLCLHTSLLKTVFPSLTVFLIFHFKILYIVRNTAIPVEPFGVIRKNWNDTEKISMAPAQG